NLKGDFTYYASANHTIEFGLSTIHYKLHPGKYGPAASGSQIVPAEVETEQAQESALYLSEKWNATDNLSIQAGIRYSLYNFLGPKNVNEYASGVPKQADNVLATKAYSGGDFIKTYSGPEYRLAVRYSLSPTFSIK